MDEAREYLLERDGFICAATEIAAGTASFVMAKQRGLYPESQDARIAWDRGYDNAICAYRLGHDLDNMAKAGFAGEPSTSTAAHTILLLLDGQWPLTIRPDPRDPKTR